MQPYKVLVVDDSAFMRKIIADIISEDAAFKVVDTAKNGMEALEKTRLLKPDVVTMDVEMPVMSGLEALRRMMDNHPVPVIMLSSLTREGSMETLRALEWGAVDFVPKPSGSISLDLHDVKQLLLEKLHAAVQANVRRPAGAEPEPKPEQASEKKADKKPPAAKQLLSRPEPAAEGSQQPVPAPWEHLVAIGTSTGGPRALQLVLTRLPAQFKAPVLVVQHMPPKFTNSLARRLDSLCEIRVVEAEDGMRLEPGTAYIAPGGFHMTVVRQTDFRIRLLDDAPRKGHRPSVDVLFESLLPFRELKRHIVLMTGMGSDGAMGMKALRDAGAVTTIAEAESTCVVYGMPRRAVELNGAQYVLPNYEIADQLIRAVNA